MLRLAADRAGNPDGRIPEQIAEQGLVEEPRVRLVAYEKANAGTTLDQTFGNQGVNTFSGGHAGNTIGLGN